VITAELSGKQTEVAHFDEVGFCEGFRTTAVDERCG
jgi:hypothetical protein